MAETKKTVWFIGIALGLAIIALAVSPGRITPTAFLDQGEPFFADFTDPNAATTLEVIDFDDATGAARPFKVTFEKGRWIIPSHHNYPADAKDRLARTAAGVISLHKDDFRSDNVSDHEACGVIDPLDETTTTLSGRGRRVTFKDKDDNILADLIVGNQVPERSNFRFVRMPGQKRIYAVRTDMEVSIRFEDWIETDLTEVERGLIDQVRILDYSINEKTGRVEERDNLILTLKDSVWSASRMKASEEIDGSKMSSLLGAIDELAIVGVRPKPEGLSKTLKKATREDKINRQDMLSLQSKGFYFTRDGELKSNEGEMRVRTTAGVAYTLRFGEVLYGSGLAVTAGTAEGEEKKGTGESRYLFITTEFDPSAFPEPKKPSSTEFLKKADSILTDADRRQKELYKAHEEWKRKIDAGQLKSDKLNARFADWYYVISADSFDKLHLMRKDLVVEKDKEI
jgi:hypothetical protein